ncbi:DUF3108 domain-containing protein [Telluria mixta]|uniref:DUF3108 domain-containing protein n=1 Tax=Telluria mixta TaxID=34071 RepID=A0ABT2BUU2_9BURK|nr:DUF3108 domain-containing protein [Telluria mixta]MCS0628821.1 DUF3108 domain-containing protein [Telluria mixta]WEM97276.1 DUF3108 domain-containing protein [Telluria mixta]
MRWLEAQAAARGRTGYTRRMSPAYATTRRRRQLVLGALTILLHVLVFVWFARQMGQVPDPSARTGRAPMTAELVEAPQPRPLPPVPPPQPALEQPPLPEVDPEPVVPAPAPGAPDAALTPESDGIAATDAPGQQTGQGGAAVGAGTVQSRQDDKQDAAPQAQAQAEAAQKPQPAAPEARRYKVDMPPSADITLDVARTDANGTKWSGDALLSWRVTPSSYRVKIEAGIRVVFAHVNLLTLTSEGTVGDEGFVPTLMTEKRRGRAMTATHFNRQEGTLTFSASGLKYPLVPGAQDKASVPLQLTAIARGDSKQLSGNIDILVGEDRDASVFTFTVAGQEQLDTRLGRIATWHLVRPPKPGSYNSRLELWLAPGYGWYPVQIRNVEASGAVTTQTASKIVIQQAGS